MTKWLDGYTIVFDLDGTLVDTAPDLLASLNHVLGESGLPPVDLDTIATMIGLGARAMIVKGMAHHGATPDGAAHDAAFDAFLAYYAEHIADGSRPFDGAVPALEALSEAGAILAVCTNKRQAHSDQLIDALGLTHHFATIVGADSVPARKPSGDHIVRTILAAGGDPSRAVMVGDSRTDERAAPDAGLPFIFVPFGYEAETTDQIGADAVVSHYSELLSALSRLLS